MLIFGYGVARAARILRIANLHPELMDRYSAGEISDPQAQAYAATEDRSLQIAVYRQLGETTSHPHERAAGGGFEADLFADDGAGIVRDPDLLRALAAQRLDADKRGLVGRGVMHVGCHGSRRPPRAPRPGSSVPPAACGYGIMRWRA